ncbi:hypothetical protein L226DRAFT_617494 [Lentinus tigrinus ALCF2SS1-7]|uniref:Uncharacterized protein n=1 Tax=Lentinus tigrinus ALCF2SS1-6 TaxID=1328759 RepID=A0A5C2RQB9_9APHY|nr:hypothetical protein L227DRAFT_658303 [Lentinus tigrinus ALCF2SS1-6]RPD68479.1 hypothetical protein L226DRAFT_617494 [Lentinus tigrinus ALCF2SS1-7]
MSVVPGHTPADEDALNAMLEVMGATPQTRDQVLESYNNLVKTAGVRVIGMKPKPTDPVYSVQIPNSPFVFRIWEGGMGFYSHFCVEFNDPRRKVSINLPPEHSLHPTGPPGGFGYMPHPEVSPSSHPLSTPMNRQSSTAITGQLPSLERSMHGLDPGGREWIIPEGTYITLRREGHPLFTFQMPNRRPPTIAQPRWGVA